MYDSLLFNTIISAAPNGCKLIFIGDANQLMPIKPGCPFEDCLRSDLFDRYKLSVVKRQDSSSGIFQSSIKIANGIPLNREKFDDFKWVDCENDEQIMSELLRIYPKVRDSYGKNQCQILCPKRVGTTGSIAINNMIQKNYNDSFVEKEALFVREEDGKKIFFSVGDRVIQTENDYKLQWKKLKNDVLVDIFGYTGVVNGEIGYIWKIDRANNKVTVYYQIRLLSMII